MGSLKKPMAADAKPPSVQMATRRAPTREQLDSTEPAAITAGEKPLHVPTEFHAKMNIHAVTVSTVPKTV